MKILKTFLGLGLIAMVLLSVSNVAGRYVFDSAILWADEAVVFAMIVLVWLGGIVCAWESSELRMALLVDSLSTRLSHWVKLGQHLIVAVACAYAAWLSFGFVAKVYRFGMTAEATGIPVWTVHVSITVSLIFIALIALWHAFKLAGTNKNASKPIEPGSGDRS